MQLAGPRLRIETAALLLFALVAGCATANKDVSLASELGASGFETRIDDRGVTVLVTDVLFAYDSDALAPDGAAAVAKIASIVQRLTPERALICEGHTDAKGTGAYNFELSLRRARRVAEALAGAGIETGRISSQGYGEASRRKRSPMAPTIPLDARAIAASKS